MSSLTPTQRAWLRNVPGWFDYDHTTFIENVLLCGYGLVLLKTVNYGKTMWVVGFDDTRRMSKTSRSYHTYEQARQVFEDLRVHFTVLALAGEQPKYESINDVLEAGG